MDFWKKARDLWSGENDETRSKRTGERQREVDAVYRLRQEAHENLERIPKETPLAKRRRLEAAETKRASSILQKIELDTQEGTARRFHPDSHCTFDNLATAPSRGYLSHLKSRNTLKGLDQDTIHRIDNYIIRLVQYLHKLYGGIPLSAHLVDMKITGGNRVREGSIDAQYSYEGGSDIDGRMRARVTPPHYIEFCLTGERFHVLQTAIDHELHHFTSLGGEPDTMPISEAKAVLGEAMAAHIRLSHTQAEEPALCTPLSGKEEGIETVPLQGMPEVLAADHAGGWGVPEFGSLEFEGPVGQHFYSAWANELMQAMGGNIYPLRYMMQAEVNHVQSNLDSPVGQRWLQSGLGLPLPREDEWIHGMDEVLSRKGVVGFQDKYQRMLTDRIPEGRRILWIPNSSDGGVLSVASFTRNPHFHVPADKHQVQPADPSLISENVADALVQLFETGTIVHDLKQTFSSNREVLPAPRRQDFRYGTVQSQKSFCSFELIDAKGKMYHLHLPLPKENHFIGHDQIIELCSTVKIDPQDLHEIHLLSVVGGDSRSRLVGRKKLLWNSVEGTLIDPTYVPAQFSRPATQ